MERWFVVRTRINFFSLGSRDGIIIFVSEPDLKNYVGKSLEDVKPYIVENGGKAKELSIEEKIYDIETMKQVTEKEYINDLNKRFRKQ